MVTRVCALRFFSSVSPVILDYQDLVDHKDLTYEIGQGFGLMGLGVIGVKNIPSYATNRLNLLSYARQLSFLDPSKKKEILTRSLVEFAGLREPTLNPKDIVDYLKCTYYANPEVDSSVDKGDWADNIWPRTCLEGFESAFKTLGRQMVDVGTLISCHLDRQIKEKYSSYKDNNIEIAMSTHKNHISRLLYYLPQSGNSHEWCLWHQDFTFLTALAPSLYTNHATGEVISDQEIDDPNTGLFVRNRKSQQVKIKVSPDVMLFQAGEIIQIVSGGMFECTPHSVLNNGKLGELSRSTFITFMQPKGHFLMDSVNPEGMFIEHEGMYSLRERWRKGMDFNEYIQAVIKNIY